MEILKASVSSTVAAANAAPPLFHRSGAVARMLQMPVATLRVWERRYGLSLSASTPSGQRRYSEDDVRRLALIKQLTLRGHAIGSLAALDMQQLQRVAATHAQTLVAALGTEQADVATEPPPRPWRLAVVGAALGARLNRPALLRRVGWPVVLLGPFDDLAQAADQLRGSDFDALLLHEPQPQADWLAGIKAAAPAFADVPKAMLYNFAADAVCDALAMGGTALLREPQPDAVLVQWLNSLAGKSAQPAQAAADQPPVEAQTVPPRRWDDAALTGFAALSPTVACECPRHVAQLLMQLLHFESYSAACAHRNAADAELHAYLHRVATATRTRFETALEHVALHEGLPLPSQKPYTALQPAPCP